MPRKAAGTDGRKMQALNMRTTAEVRDRLAAAASASGRSLAQEVEYRVTRSLLQDEDQSHFYGGQHNAQLVRLLTTALVRIEKNTGMKWTEDTGTADAVAKAFEIITLGIMNAAIKWQNYPGLGAVSCAAYIRRALADDKATADKIREWDEKFKDEPPSALQILMGASRPFPTRQHLGTLSAIRALQAEDIAPPDKLIQKEFENLLARDEEQKKKEAEYERETAALRERILADIDAGRLIVRDGKLVPSDNQPSRKESEDDK